MIHDCDDDDDDDDDADDDDGYSSHDNSNQMLKIIVNLSLFIASISGVNVLSGVRSLVNLPLMLHVAVDFHTRVHQRMLLQLSVAPVGRM